MSAPFRRRPPAASARRAGASGCPRLALRYAHNLHEATDRGLPEAAALVSWVSAHAASLGLPGTQAPDGGLVFLDEEPSSRSRGRGGVAAGWLRALAKALDLDPVEAEIAELALCYRLDRRVERLFDALSECRNGAHRFHRDTGLIAAMVAAFPAEVEARLTLDARLLAGLLRIGGLPWRPPP